MAGSKFLPDRFNVGEELLGEMQTFNTWIPVGQDQQTPELKSVISHQMHSCKRCSCAHHKLRERRGNP